MPRTLRDPNLLAAPVVTNGLTWHSALASPFVLEGFPFRRRGGPLFRLPQRGLAQLPPLLVHVAAQPAGAGLRFAASGDRLAVRVTLGRNETSRHCTLAATHGIDAYVEGPLGWTFVGNLCVEQPSQEWLAELRVPAALARRLGDHPRQWLLHLPLQNPVVALQIGVVGTVQRPRARRMGKPLVCYGSSITQGFAASRPGLTWTNIVARALDAELIPLGFGGSAKGEPAVADAIARLDAACVVIDYDHNAPSREHLAATLPPFLARIRQAHPLVPLVLASSPNFHADPQWWGARRAVIRAAARAVGGPVTFVDGERYHGDDLWREATIDLCHPNDLGFRLMADQFLPAIRRCLRQAERLGHRTQR
jgi:hypothetical protein